MPVVDLYLPDDLPISADADLGRSVAAVVDAATREGAPPCAVFVHRLPVYAVVSADAEGVRTVRVQVSRDAGPGTDLAADLDDVVRSYLRSLRTAAPTRITVSVQAAHEVHDAAWSQPVRGSLIG